MSGYGSLRKRTHEAAQEPDRNDTGCAAHGCPCRGSVSTEGGRFTCSAHAAVPSDRWPFVTERLLEFSWLIGFIDEMQKMDRQRGDWRAFATQFWKDSDEHCLPHERENAGPYQLRMRAELMYRCGITKNRPEPRLPQAPKGRWGNAGGLAGGES